MGPIQTSVTATGTLQVKDTVEVGTRVSGTVSALYADFNSHVRKGEVIARIDTTLLYASLLDAQSTLDKALAQDQQAQADLKRNQPLFDKNLISQSDLDTFVANAKVSAAAVASARAGVTSAVINLHYATITSPIDGIVMSRAVDVGQTVAASLSAPTLFIIGGDLHKMQVLASIDEADIGNVKVGQSASFTVDAYPDTQFSGTVSQIRLEPIIDQNVVTYNVMINVDNPDLKLMSGMTATLTIAVVHKDSVLLVPAAALRFQPPRKPKSPSDSTHKHEGGGQGGGGWKKNGGQAAPDRGRIFLLENGKLKFVKVKVGITDGTKTEIESDSVQAGDSVVTGMESAQGVPTAAKPFGMQAGGAQGGMGRGIR